MVEPKVQPEEVLTAAGDTAGNMATSTTIICASGDRDGVGDGVTEEETVRVAMTELVTDGEGATDEVTVCDRETDLDTEAVALGEAVTDADFMDDRELDGDGKGDPESVGDGGGVGGVGGVELLGAPGPNAYTKPSCEPT